MITIDFTSNGPVINNGKGMEFNSPEELAAEMTFAGIRELIAQALPDAPQGKPSTKLKAAERVFKYAPEAKKRGGRKYPEEAELVWLCANPKKRGKSAERAAAYWGAATVGDMLSAGATRADVSWDVKHGYVEVK